MKIITLLLLLTLFLTSCGYSNSECQTKECFDYKLEQAKLEAIELEKLRAHELEELKIKAQIEANKPVEVKVAEIQSEELSIGEGLGIAAGVGGAVWVASKILDL